LEACLFNWGDSYDAKVRNKSTSNVYFKPSLTAQP